MFKKFKNKKAKQIDTSPGTLIHIGEQKMESVEVSVIDYNKEKATADQIQDLSEIAHYKKSDTISWLNVTGLHELEIIEKVGQEFEIHSLVLEDVLDTGQRPKIDIYDNYIFIVAKMLQYDQTQEKLDVEQVSFILGADYLITFQEKTGDVFDRLRDWIQHDKGRLRKRGADYLAYALLDSIVDHYFLVLEKIGNQIEKMEDNVFLDPDPEIVEDIQRLKSDMIYIRKSVWPMRESINLLLRDENPFFKDNTEIFLKDLYDHTIQVIDTVETFREMISSLLDVYLSSISNKMNEVMKVLTIIATIFIPLTFIAGIYGMNFEYMPELKMPWAYPAVISIFVIIAIVMLLFFKKKKWL